MSVASPKTKTVQNTGFTYYTGPPENNPDGALHVRFFDTSDTSDGFYTIGVGFEDLYGGGDEDYQDIFFQAKGVSTVAPEPATPTRGSGSQFQAHAPGIRSAG